MHSKKVTMIFSKKFETFSFEFVLQIREIAITCLANATELQTMHHLIAKDKVPEQHI